ncbi:MAG: tetratricopeptide repeat protein [Gemmatimonadetes bacterium]|nr:tetratricopeptide repeat protein [Gemmatimonadota bacterium]
MSPSIEQEIRDLHELFGSSRDPEGRAFVPLADAYRRAGNYDRALGILADGSERHPDLPSALLVEGLVLRDQGDEAGAESAFRRVLEFDPDNARALVELGRILALRPDADAAEASDAFVRRGVALDPTLAGASDLAPEDGGESGDDGLVEVADLGPGWTESSGDAVAGDAAGDWPATPDPVEEPLGGSDAADGADSDAGGLAIDWDLDDGTGWSEPVDADDAPPVSDEAELDPWSAPEVEGDSFDRLPTGEVPPEALIMDFTDVVPDLEPGRPPEFDDAEDEDPVLPTRTLGELYARQGLIDEAIAVFEALASSDPTELEAAARLLELRAGSVPGAVEDVGSDTTSDEPAGVDATGGPELPEAEAKPSIRESLRTLLTWTPAALDAAADAVPDAVPDEAEATHDGPDT